MVLAVGLNISCSALNACSVGKMAIETVIGEGNSGSDGHAV